MIHKNNNGKSHIKYWLILCNIVLMAAAVLFTLLYSRQVRTSQEVLKRDNFCDTVETMKQISVRYLEGEYTTAENWASYIQKEHMSMEEAMDYIRSVSAQEDSEAHFVDMDTFDAWSTNYTDGSNTMRVYRTYVTSDDARLRGYVVRLREMFDGKKYIFGKYKIPETQRDVISVGMAVPLREADGGYRSYLLLRVVPVERMKELWLFPVSFASAEIGLIAQNGDYVIPSYAMKSENFLEFVRGYNFQDDYNGADAFLAQLKTQDKGLMKLKDSRGRECYWYYSSLEEFGELDVLGYIPIETMVSGTDTLSIVIAVSGVLILLAVLDGAYILSINRQLRETADVARRASNAKTQFLSTMSHDIRTPLNAVLGMTELAQSHIGDAEYVQECLRKISLSGNHLLTLVNDILEISRVESGRIHINPAPFDVLELADNLESITRSQATGRGLTFQVSMGEIAHPFLCGDKLRLTQVYLNLLNNAIKYSESGDSVELRLWEETAEENQVILACMVKDTGIGMSKEFQKTMYDSFTRVEDGRIDKIQGTGLGLAIVKRMVELMKGSIDCDSAEGVGTTFTVRIPIAVAAEAPEVHRPQEDSPAFDGTLKGVRILIAEDNDLNWEIISQVLEGYGMDCVRAENGRICVDMLKAAPPDSYDLVLMDIQMPVLNGRDATRELRASERKDLHRIPIIAMTADAFAEDVQQCLDAGMDAHLSKPIEVDKVLAKIRLLLSRRNNSDERRG